MSKKKLFKAVSEGRTDDVIDLLNQGIDIKSTNQDKQTLLIVAADAGHIEIVKLLVEKGADISETDNSNLTAMNYALKNGHIKVVEFLLDKGLDIEKLYTHRTALQIASEFNHLSIVEMLCKRGANINYIDVMGRSALNFAAEFGANDIAKYLLDNGASIDNKDARGKSVLHIASQEGNIELVKLLINRGANLFQKDKENKTAIDLSKTKEIRELIQEHINKVFLNIFSNPCKTYLSHYFYYVANGIRLDYKDSKGLNALHYVVINNLIDLVNNINNFYYDRDKYGKTPLHFAAEKGHFHFVEILLNAEFVNTKKSKINEKDSQNMTAIHYAAMNGHFKTVRFLLDRGAQINEKDNNKNTALHLAVTKGHFDIVRLLIEKGANIDEKNKNHNTVIEIAKEHGHIEIVNYLESIIGSVIALPTLHEMVANEMVDQIRSLIDHGAKLNEFDVDGQTALHVAVVTQNIHIIKILLEKKADLLVKNNEGVTPIELARTNNVLEAIAIFSDKFLVAVAKNHNLQELQKFLESGIDINTQNAKQETALHIAVSKGFEEVALFLVEAGINVNTRNAKQETALHIAVQNELEQIVSLLLKSGIEVHAQNLKQETALHIAVSKENKNIIQNLLSGMHNFALTNKDGKTAFSLAKKKDIIAIMERVISAQLDNLLKSKSYTENYDYIYKIAVELKKYNLSDGRNSLLHLSIQNKSITNIQFLLSNGADLFFLNENGKTPLQLAKDEFFDQGFELIYEQMRRDFFEAIRSNKKDLVSKFIKVGIDVNSFNDNHETALHLAVKLNFENIVKLLLENGSDIRILDVKGNDPYKLSKGVINKTFSMYLVRKIDEFLSRGNEDEVVSYIKIAGTMVFKEEDKKNFFQQACTKGFKKVIEEFKLLRWNLKQLDIERDSGIHIAARFGHFSIIEVLYDEKLINAENKQKMTPLLIASEKGFFDIVKFLVEKGADINAKDKNKNTALHLAAINGHLDIVQLLIRSNIDTEALNISGQRAIDLARINNHDNVVESLLSSYSKAASATQVLPVLKDLPIVEDVAVKTQSTHMLEDLQYNHLRQNILHKLAYEGNLEELKIQLRLKMSEINAQDKDGQTPLYLAILAGHFEIIRFLIISGANVNIPSNEFSALQLACIAYYGTINLEIIKLLIENGAEVNKADKLGFTELHILVSFQFDQQIFNYLLENGADISKISRNGNTVLHQASQIGNQQAILALFKAGYLDINKANNNGDTALHLAARNGKEGAIELLLSKGADVNRANNDGNTALHLAARNGNKFVFDRLLKNGADINLLNKKGETINQIAQQANNVQILEILEKMSKRNNSDSELTAHIIHADEQRPILPIDYPDGVQVHNFSSEPGRFALYTIRERQQKKQCEGRI